MEIDDNIIRDLIEQDYNLYDIYIGELEYNIVAENTNKSLLGGHIEYSFKDIDGEEQYGIVTIKRYIENKREKSLNKLL